MGWMPAKAWTNKQRLSDYRHFGRVMTGRRGSGRWVELAAVLDPSHRERVLWTELNDRSRWISGWQPIVDTDADSPAK